MLRRVWVDQRSGSPPLKEARRKNMLVLLQRSARKEVVKSSGFIQNASFRPQKSKLLLKTIRDVLKKFIIVISVISGVPLMDLLVAGTTWVLGNIFVMSALNTSIDRKCLHIICNPSACIIHVEQRKEIKCTSNGVTCGQRKLTLHPISKCSS